MTDDVERNGNGEVEALEGEETIEPRSKYERIMLAAVEAGRLNEEMRRKGIKLENKVTIEAIKRVDDGKVKGILRGSVEPEEEVLAPAAPPMRATPLFEEPPLTALPADDDDSGDEDEEASSDDEDSFDPDTMEED